MKEFKLRSSDNLCEKQKTRTMEAKKEMKHKKQQIENNVFKR